MPCNGCGPQCFSGPDRFEFHPAFGRPIRMGELCSLKIADTEMVCRAIANGDTLEGFSPNPPSRVIEPLLMSHYK